MPPAARFRHRNLPLLLLKAREALMERRRPALRSHGLSDQQWRVLRVLADAANAQGLDTGSLAREAHLLGPSLTGVLARMERDGLVRRQRSDADARRSVVFATEDGLVVASALRSAVEAQYEALELQLGQRKLEQLYELLDDLIALQGDDEEDKDPMTEDPKAAARAVTSEVTR